MDDNPDPESWQASYRVYGHQYVEPLEYLPCPGSVRFRELKCYPEDEGPTYPVEVNYP